jgi:hypothetical protein
MAICIECGVDFEPGHRGYANKCYDCSFKRKPTAEQQRNWDQGGDFFLDNAGERIYFDVVNRWTVSVPVS